MSDEIDRLFSRLRGSPFVADPNMIPQQGVAGDGNVQPSGWYESHGFSSFIGITNALYDPSLERFPSVDPIPTSAATTTDPWRVEYTLNSGTAPTFRRAQIAASRINPDSNQWNSAKVELRMSTFGAAADTTSYVYPSDVWDPSGIYTGMEYMVAQVKVRMAGTNLANATTWRVRVELLRDGSLVANSDWYDLLTATAGLSKTLSAYYQDTAPESHTWLWRLRMDAVVSASGPSCIIEFGEPAIGLAFTPDPPPFTPQIATWSPTVLRGTTFHETLNSIQETSGRWVITGPRVASPSTAQTLAAGTAILADAEVVQINSAGNVTITAAPTIANGADGQVLTIVNVDSADTITLQDQGTLASSNLRLTAATVALAPRQSIQLMYSSSIGDWVQIGSLVAVL